MKHSSKSSLFNPSSILAGTEKLSAPASRSLTQFAQHYIRQRFPVFLATAALAIEGTPYDISHEERSKVVLEMLPRIS